LNVAKGKTNREQVSLKKKQQHDGHPGKKQSQVEM
jgi:hypothetical protein